MLDASVLVRRVLVDPRPSRGEEFDDVAVLTSKCNMELVAKVPSDVSGVDALLMQDARTGVHKVALLSAKDRVLAKGIHLGGFGPGTYVEMVDAAVAGVPFLWHDGDRSMVELDNASFGTILAGKPAGFTTLSLYQLLRQLERAGTVDHRLAYSSVERATDAGKDSFVVTVTTPMLYKYIAEEAAGPKKKKAKAELKLTSKNIFKSVGGQLPSAKLTVVFRFRYEPVGKSIKVQKPYVALREAMELSGGRPQLL